MLISFLADKSNQIIDIVLMVEGLLSNQLKFRLVQATAIRIQLMIDINNNNGHFNPFCDTGTCTYVDDD